MASTTLYPVVRLRFEGVVSSSGAEARRQAEAEGVTLLRSESNATGFMYVYIRNNCKTKPYEAHVRRSGERVSLGRFATAEEAALAFAHSPEGRAAAAAATNPVPVPLTVAEAKQQAETEGLMLLRSDSSNTGFHGVRRLPYTTPKPYAATVWRDGWQEYLGSFATAEEAALNYARTPEGRAVAAAALLAPPPSVPLTAAEAWRQAEAEGLTLLPSQGNCTGFRGVSFSRQRALTKPYQAKLWADGNVVSIGYFVTAEEAALARARTPEGRAEAAAVAAAVASGSGDNAIVKTEVVAEPSLRQESPNDVVVKEDEAPPAWPDGAVVKTEVKGEPSTRKESPAMPDGAVVKEEALPGGGPAEVQVATGNTAQKRRRLGSA